MANYQEHMDRLILLTGILFNKSFGTICEEH